MLLVGYVAILCTWDIVVEWRRQVEAEPLRLSQLLEPSQWADRVALGSSLEVAKFALLGLLAALAIRPGRGAGATRRWRRWLGVLITGVALAVFLQGVRMARVPEGFFLILPLLGVALGIWLGCQFLRGLRSTLWIVPKLGLGLVILAALGVLAFWLVVTPTALTFDAPRVTPTEKRRLMESLRASQSLPDGTMRLRLSEKELNLLAATGFDHLPLNGKADMALGWRTVAADVSLEIPFSCRFGRYVNSRGLYRLEIEAGKLRFQPLQLQLGRLAIPSPLLKPLGAAAVSVACSQPHLKEVIASIEQLRFADGSVEVTYRSGKLREDVELAFRAQVGESQDVVEATALQLRHLAESAAAAPVGDDGLLFFVRRAFALAKARSRVGDPIVENRGAVLALAILFGHPRMETLVGEVGAHDLRTSSRLPKLTLRDRQDWVRHFLVSAGLAVLTNRAVADSAGRFKEEIDAGEGGSGFSFADLLADRAGTQFGLAAVRDPQAARRMQDRLSGDFRIDDVFPPAADLPEGIPDARLQSEYGGVGGRRYNQLLEQIERRLTSCSILNPI